MKSGVWHGEIQNSGKAYSHDWEGIKQWASEHAEPPAGTPFYPGARDLALIVLVLMDRIDEIESRAAAPNPQQESNK